MDSEQCAVDSMTALDIERLSEPPDAPLAHRAASRERQGQRVHADHCPLPTVHYEFPLGRINGNRMTSRIEGLLDSSITNRSMPTPTPPVGGSPYSSART